MSTRYFPEETMTQLSYWANFFASEWQQVPMRLHSSEIAGDGSPQWHHDFERWLTAEHREKSRRPQNGAQRMRTTKVMRSLRSFSPRSYEVAYRVLVLGERVEDTTRWLNERARRIGVPFPPHRPQGPHYTRKDTLALLIAGVEYAKQLW